MSIDTLYPQLPDRKGHVYVVKFYSDMAYKCKYPSIAKNYFYMSRAMEKLASMLRKMHVI